jgi:hypothetical protein
MANNTPKGWGELTLWTGEKWCGEISNFQLHGYGVKKDPDGRIVQVKS